MEREYVVRLLAFLFDNQNAHKKYATFGKRFC